MFKIAVLTSGGETNLQSVIDSIEAESLSCKIEMVIGGKEGILVLRRAEEKGIKTCIVSRKEYKDTTCDRILELTKGKVDLIVLAEYLSILQGNILREFKDKIANIYSSLVPSFCGPRMYGLKVHEAVINFGVRYSGCTVHFVNEEVDGGVTALQEVVPVYFKDTREALQKRILRKKHEISPRVIDLASKNRAEIINGKTRIEQSSGGVKKMKRLRRQLNKVEL